MRIPLNPIACSAIQSFSASNEDVYPFDEAKKLLDTANTQLDSLIRKHDSRDALPRLQRLYQSPWLSVDEHKQLESSLWTAKWFVHASLHCAKALGDLYEEAKELEKNLESQESERNAVQQQLEAINKKQQNICFLLDTKSQKEESISYAKNTFIQCKGNPLTSENIPDNIINQIEELNRDLLTKGLISEMEIFAEKELSLVNKRADQSFLTSLLTAPKTEKFIMCIASLTGAIGFSFHFPITASIITAIGILPTILRLINLIIEMRLDAKIDDTLKLAKDVIELSIRGLKNILENISSDTIDIAKNKPQIIEHNEKFKEELTQKLQETIEKTVEKTIEEKMSHALNII